MLNKKAHNARLRGWQRIPLNLNTPTATTAAQWDWKRHALTVPLEAFVRHDFQYVHNIHPGTYLAQELRHVHVQGTCLMHYDRR